MTELLDDDLLALMLADEADTLCCAAPGRRLDHAPLSFAQQRLWLEQQYAPSSFAYNLPRVLRIRGALQPQALQAALDALIDRHDILRTAFREVEGATRQQVERGIHLHLALHDLTGLAAAQRAEVLAAEISRQARHVFALDQAPLIRTSLWRTDAQEHVLLLNMHHIVSDAWSNAILLQDLASAYAQAAQGLEARLPALTMQYADHAAWQRHEYLASSACVRSGEYWRGYLGDTLPVLELPQDWPRQPEQAHLAARHVLACPTSLSSDLQAFCQRHGLTPFALALGAWQLLLGRYSNQSDFTVGVPNANRNRGETQGLVGYFVSSLVFRAHLDPACTTLQYLHRLRGESLAALEHADYPLELLLEHFHRPGSQAHNPLFQVLFNWRTQDELARRPDWGGLTLEFLDSGEQQAKFDLSLDVEYSRDALVATFEYSRDLYGAATIERMARHWRNLLEALIAAPEAALGDLPMLDADERQHTLRQWNPQARQMPPGECLHTLIERHAQQHAASIALSWNGEQLSYAQLNREANILAHRLIDAGVGPDVRVGLAAERCPQMLVGLLAILKAGGAYVPLDPAYPHERLAYMIQDSGLQLVLAQASLRERLPLPAEVQCLALEPDIPDDPRGERNPGVVMHPDNLAYVIYTSGSTGRPKGALLAHRNVVRLFQATQRWFNFSQDDVWCLFHSYAFDFSVWEIFGALLHGARLVIVPHAVSRSPEDFHALLCAERVTVLNQTPSAFKQLMPVACQARQASALSLRYVIFGGEAIDVMGLQPWFERFGDRQPQLINMYGITETTVHVTYRPLRLADLAAAATSPLGAPIDDLTWYLLDAQLNPVAQGCTGELYVGRAGLARGYHQRSELTATRFVPDPFDATPGARLYRTGDLARYDGEGRLEYIGRIDHQVKIRGFRIELGEIQACLQALPQVQDCVVLTDEGPAGLQLLGYVVPVQPPVAGLREQLLAALRARLPDYMVPAHLLLIDRFALNANGKLDRQALPRPGVADRQQAYVAPAGELEQQLAGLWQQALGIERVGATDNFFELGGHSILAIQLVASVRSHLQVELRLQDLLAHQTVAELAAHVSRQRHAQDACVVRLNDAPVSAPKLFCVHPSGGIVFCYQPLAKKLKDQAQVHGILYRQPQREEPDDWEALVADYSREILEAQPQGPYHLLGWSLGGPIALDISARLEQQGHEVAFLGLVDCTLPQSYYPAGIARFQRADEQQRQDPMKAELHDAAHYFDLLFPAFGQATANYLRDNPDSSARQFYAWACEQLGPEQSHLLALMQGMKSEIVNAQAFSVHERLVAAFDDFTFKPLRARPYCWWATPEKTAEELEACERTVRRYTGQHGAGRSWHSPLLHRSMIFDDALLDSVIDAFLHSTTRC